MGGYLKLGSALPYPDLDGVAVLRDLAVVGVHSLLLVLLLLAGEHHHAAGFAADGLLGGEGRDYNPSQQPGARQLTHLVTEGLAATAAGGAHPPGRPGARAPPLLGW